MEFTDFLRACTKEDGAPLSERSIDHYDSGLRVTSKMMLQDGVITKPLKDMDLFELDLAIALIFANPDFAKKDKKGKRMYSNALRHYRLFAYSCRADAKTEDTEVERVEHDETLSITEREAIVKARVGQGIYRDKLLAKYDKTCIITGVRIPQVLIASHIKPWAVSTNGERVSEDNGFLLSATYDRLFDQGLISFENNGRLLLSNMITDENAARLRLDRNREYCIKYNPSMADFMEYHRDVIFVK